MPVLPFVACLLFLGFWAGVLITFFKEIHPATHHDLKSRNLIDSVLVLIALVIATICPFLSQSNLSASDVAIGVTPVVVGLVAAQIYQVLTRKKALDSIEQMKIAFMVYSLIAATAPLLFLTTFVVYIVVYVGGITALAITIGVVVAMFIPTIDVLKDTNATIKNVNHSLPESKHMLYANMLPITSGILWTIMLISLIIIT